MDTQLPGLIRSELWTPPTLTPCVLGIPKRPWNQGILDKIEKDGGRPGID